MKYLESKAGIADEILPYINNYIMLNNIDIYIEPFVGGCNIIDKVICNTRIALDNNKYLIELFKRAVNIGDIPYNITKEEYLDTKAYVNRKNNKYEDWFIGAAGFLASKQGKFFDTKNESISTVELEKIYSNNRKELIDQIPYLKDVKFATYDYLDMKANKSLIYADPPLLKFKTDKFWDKVREWSKNNIVLITYNNAPSDFNTLWDNGKTKLFVHKSLDNTKDNTYDF